MSDRDHRAVYDRSAAEWHGARGPLAHEARWLDLATADLCPGARVLDLGCGSGHPIAAALLGRGFAVTGVDFAPAMLAIARQTLPAGQWLEADLTDLPELGQFDAILGWDSLFHLSAAEQRRLLPRLAGWLQPGGHLLFTAGPQAGEVWGAVSGGPVWHASLSPSGYVALLEAAGLHVRRFVAEDPQTAGRTVWLFQRLALAAARPLG